MLMQHVSVDLFGFMIMLQVRASSYVFIAELQMFEILIFFLVHSVFLLLPQIVSLCYEDSDSSVLGYIVQQKLYGCNTYLFCPHASHLKLLVLVIYICPELFLHGGEDGWKDGEE
jgi:hypothetical protein